MLCLGLGECCVACLGYVMPVGSLHVGFSVKLEGSKDNWLLCKDILSIGFLNLKNVYLKMDYWRDEAVNDMENMDKNKPLGFLTMGE